MQNAHHRFGTLEFTKRMKDTTTQIRLHLDRFVGEAPESEHDQAKAHLISVVGGDADVGAVWAGVVEGSFFTVQGPGLTTITVTLGKDAQCFRGTLTLRDRKRPARHLVAVSAELAATRPGSGEQEARTILCDDHPVFVLYRVAQRFGLPVAPDWSDWFISELTRRRAIRPLTGFGCSPVLVTGTKEKFLKWIGTGLRQRRVHFPHGTEPVVWTLPKTFLQADASDELSPGPADEPAAWAEKAIYKSRSEE